MRHGKKINHLGRTDAHRKAMLANMASSLILHKRINTTVAKAKALRKYVEPLITKAKNDTTHSRRTVFSYLQNKHTVTELFREVAEKVSDRPGGYTRIIKIGTRFGDNAEMCFIELVDYNEVYSQSGTAGEAGKSKTTRRSRSKAKKATEANVEETAAEETVVAEAVAEEKEVENVVADDLTKIEGIGPKIAEVLAGAGISSFAALTEKTVEEVSAILADNNLSSHSPDTWAKQAELAVAGKWDELKTLQDELQGGREEEK